MPPREARLDRMLRNLSWPSASATKSKKNRVLRFEDFEIEPHPLRNPPDVGKRLPKGLPPTSGKLKRSLLRFQTVALVAFLFGFGLLGFAPVLSGRRAPSRGGLGFNADSTNRRLAHFPTLRPAAEATQRSPAAVGHSFWASNGGGRYVQAIQPGLFASVEVALDLSLWYSHGVVYNDLEHPLGAYARHNSTLASFSSSRREGYKAGLKELFAGKELRLDVGRAKRRCPTGKIRVLVAVVAACCTAKGAAKRQSIRMSWMKMAKGKYGRYIDAHFFITQPPTESELLRILPSIKKEVSSYNDLIILPGPDTYMELPRKTMEIMTFAVKSPCNYTHVLKIDDDSYLRIDNLIKLIQGDHPHNSSRMHGLYAGRPQESPKPGFWPERNIRSKWYLSHEEFPVEIAPLGTKYHLGWGYLLSIDLVSHIIGQVHKYTHDSDRRPRWWGYLPWEDTIIGLLLENKASPTVDYSFRAAWSDCPPDTVVKHLDVNALQYQKELYAAETSGFWKANTIPCGGGEYPLNQERAWRIWRNSLPDVKIIGEE